MFCLKPPLPSHSHCLSTADCHSPPLSLSLAFSCCNRPLKHAATCVDTHTRTHTYKCTFHFPAVRACACSWSFSAFWQQLQQEQQEWYTLYLSLSLSSIFNLRPLRVYFNNTRTHTHVDTEMHVANQKCLIFQVKLEVKAQRREEEEEKNERPLLSASRFFSLSTFPSLPLVWC